MEVKTDQGTEFVKSVSLVVNSEGDYELQLIDQRTLPFNLIFFYTTSFTEANQAISNMTVRGAPAIGATGAYSLVLGIQELQKSGNLQQSKVYKLKEEILETRPTARDLETFVNSVIYAMESETFSLQVAADDARNLCKESENECKEIGLQSKHLIKENMGILTHCNAGALATVDYGTALSPIRLAHGDGIEFTVYVDETRPRLQGMLTAWELQNEGINHVIIADNAAGFFMQQGKIQLVIVGCDRVLKDGTVTNKIGTLEKAVLAKTFGIPFYIAMPWTTYDPIIENAIDIPIEFRDDNEITHVKTEEGYKRVSPKNAIVSNPAFDITPPEFISGYITRDGILGAYQLETHYKKFKVKRE